MAEKCPMCGAPMENGTCGYCGYVGMRTDGAADANAAAQQALPPQPAFYAPQAFPVYQRVSGKSKIAALLLCIFLGVFGGHYFYVGRIGMGILYLFTYGLFGIGWIVDVIRIATGSFKDKAGLPLRQ